MEVQSYHNALIEIEKIGFRVTWKFIDIGLHGMSGIPIQISYHDLFEYLEILLERNSEEINDVITLFSEREDNFEVDKLLQCLAEQELQDLSYELRKWRVYLLKRILDNENQDFLQGLLELMEFWLPMKDKKECPHIFPQNRDNERSIQQYFTKTMYEFLLQTNCSWLENEISNIIRRESLTE